MQIVMILAVQQWSTMARQHIFNMFNAPINVKPQGGGGGGVGRLGGI